MLREDGTLIATTLFDSRPDIKEDAAAKSKDYIRRHWTYREPSSAPDDIFERARSHALCISGMAFQDAWNIDLQRLKRCCVHVVTPGKKLIPFCAYYMTDSRGRRLFESSRLTS